jgi:hypothetical protein
MAERKYSSAQVFITLGLCVNKYLQAPVGLNPTGDPIINWAVGLISTYDWETQL